MATGNAYESLLPEAKVEMDKAKGLTALNLYTEAGVRVGRAVEAGLYAFARDIGAPVTDMRLQSLIRARNKLAECEVSILKEKSIEQVKGLAHVAKFLSQAIAVLAEDISTRDGLPTDEPKRTGALLNEIAQLTGDEVLARKVKSERAPLAEIMAWRNHAAHADPAGGTRELDEAGYMELEAKAESLLNSLSGYRVGARSAAAATGVGA